jgi:N-acyl-phosphatidylethanolamine-hydrolysing phospholipase D
MNIEFKWIGGATWILEIQGLKIACDPVLCPAETIQDYKFFKTKRLNNPVFSEDDFEDIDLWLITHSHEDHLDKHGLSKIKPGSRVVTHKSALGKLRKVKEIEIKTLVWGERISYEIKNLSIILEAMPAVHGSNPIAALLAGGVNGYWMIISTSEEILSIYITSDTVLHSKVINALRGRHADLLIPNMGAANKGSWIGTLTLSANMLRRIIKIIKPKLCIPVHFGTFDHYVEPITELDQWVGNNIVILKLGQTYEWKSNTCIN